MTISTKYDIGQKIWVLQEVNNTLVLFSDIITEITVNTAGKILYYTEQYDDELPEEYIIPYDDDERLLRYIKNY